jgi:hypothetical protein
MVASMGQVRNIEKIVIRKPEGYRPLRKYKRQKDNIKINVQGKRYAVMGWIQLI